MNSVILLKRNDANICLIEIFERAVEWVSRYEIIDKIDGKSFGIYLYKDNIEVETNLLGEILDYLDVVDSVKQFVLNNYDNTPLKEEFCLHFPLDSDALIRTHTKPTEEEYKKHINPELGSLGIKGFTLTSIGDIKDVKYYYMKNGVVTTLKYSPNGKYLDSLSSTVTTYTPPMEVSINRDDGQSYRMYSHHNYDSFSEEYIK